eukprot:999036-Rhodomonas_salina.3
MAGLVRSKAARASDRPLRPPLSSAMLVMMKASASAGVSLSQERVYRAPLHEVEARQGEGFKPIQGKAPLVRRQFLLLELRVPVVHDAEQLSVSRTELDVVVVEVDIVVVELSSAGFHRERGESVDKGRGRERAWTR